MSTETQIFSNLTTLGFDNPSAAALFQTIARAVGLTVDNTITEMSNSEANILDIINTQRYGKSGYYTSAALAFQYGDNLTQDANGNPVYAVIDPTLQIVSQAAFGEVDSGNSSQLFLKIATLNTITGLLQPLSAPQMAAFMSYFVNFEIPGLPISIISSPANILSFNGICTYYATYDLTTLQTNLAAALITFRNSFAFNGEFFAGDLQAYLKTNVPGIRDFYISATTIDGVPFSGFINLVSGYFDYVTNYLSLITYNAIN